MVFMDLYFTQSRKCPGAGPRPFFNQAREDPADNSKLGVTVHHLFLAEIVMLVLK
jgi:hypothetical protein